MNSMCTLKVSCALIAFVRSPLVLFWVRNLIEEGYSYMPRPPHTAPGDWRGRGRLQAEHS